MTAEIPNGYPPVVRGEYVCQGEHFSLKDKVTYVILAPVANTEDTSWFKKGKTTAHIRAGQVYSIPTKNEGKSFVFGSAKWLREFEDRELCARWQARSVSSRLAEGAKRREAREGTATSALERALEPLAAAYAHLPYPQRAAFEVWVLSVLRRKG